MDDGVDLTFTDLIKSKFEYFRYRGRLLFTGASYNNVFSSVYHLSPASIARHTYAIKFTGDSTDCYFYDLQTSNCDNHIVYSGQNRSNHYSMCSFVNGVSNVGAGTILFETYGSNFSFTGCNFENATCPFDYTVGTFTIANTVNFTSCLFFGCVNAIKPVNSMIYTVDTCKFNTISGQIIVESGNPVGSIRNIAVEGLTSINIALFTLGGRTDLLYLDYDTEDNQYAESGTLATYRSVIYADRFSSKNSGSYLKIKNDYTLEMGDIFEQQLPGNFVNFFGSTAQRPTTAIYVGFVFFDTTLNKCIMCNSVDANRANPTWLV